MTCPDHETLSAFADGEVAAPGAVEIELHLSTCAACRRFVDELRALNAWGRSSLQAIKAAPRRTSLVILAVPQPFWLRLLRPVPLAAAAAVVAGLLLALWFAVQTGERAGTLPAPVRVAEKPPIARPRVASLNDRAFARWAAPYRQLRIPLVSVEEAARYSPPQIRPALPDMAAR
jgi:anti-sigma factor RsiW